MKTLLRLDKLALERPDDVALLEHGVTTSFLQLANASRALASFYISQGIPQGSVVACLKNTMTGTFIAALAGLRAGVGFIILDCDGDKNKLLKLLKISGTKLLIVEDVQNNTLEFDVPIIGMTQALEHEISALPDVPSSTLAYIEPTSGSTGDPKLVPLTQSVMQHYIDRQLESSGIEQGDRVALLGEMWMDTLMTGLNAGAQSEAFNFRAYGSGALFNWVKDRKITVMQTYPAAFRALCFAADEMLPNLRTVRLAGEIITQTDVEAFEKLCTNGSELMNYYGSTECSFVSQYCHTSGSSNAFAILPVGHEINGTSVTIVDENAKPLPDGANGEVIVRADYMAVSYLNNPEKTEGVYWSEQGGKHVLATGDLGYRDRDGNIHIVGRIDDQVKIRGYSVKYSEVEAALLRNDAIAQVAVTSHLSPRGIRQLVAHIVPEQEASFDLAGLRQQMLAQHPAYMVPNLFEIQVALPKTASGKINRRVLPPPTFEARSRKIKLWSNGKAEKVAMIWRNLLGNDQFDENDDFFDVGGDSLQAMSMVVELERAFVTRFGYESLIMDGASIREITERLSRKTLEADQTGLLRLKHAENSVPLYILPVENGEFSNWLFVLNNMADARSVHGAHVRCVNQRTRIQSKCANKLGRRAAQSILNVQAGQPCFIAGYSASTYLAIETARALLDQGATLSGLILIDPPIRALAPKTTVDIYAKSLSPLIKRADVRRSLNRTAHALWGHPARELDFADEVVFARYRARPLEGVETLVACASDGNKQLELQKSLWKEQFPGGCDIWEVPGYHNTVLRDPHANVLSPMLDAWMNEKEKGIA